MSRIPFLDVPAIYEELRDELDDAVRRVMSSGAYILGPEVTAFEEEFAAFSDTSHAIGFLRVHGMSEAQAAAAAATLDLPLTLTMRGCIVYATKAWTSRDSVQR